MIIKPKILIIDDEKDFHIQLDFAMGEVFTFESAFTTNEAIFLIKNHEYDLILVDLIMSKENNKKTGFRLVKLIKDINPSQPCIVVTESDHYKDALKAIENGAFFYLCKGEDDLENWKFKFLEAIEKKTPDQNQQTTIKELASIQPEQNFSFHTTKKPDNPQNKNFIDSSKIIVEGDMYLGDNKKDGTKQ